MSQTTGTRPPAADSFPNHPGGYKPKYPELLNKTGKKESPSIGSATVKLAPGHRCFGAADSIRRHIDETLPTPNTFVSHGHRSVEDRFPHFMIHIASTHRDVVTHNSNHLEPEGRPYKNFGYSFSVIVRQEVSFADTEIEVGMLGDKKAEQQTLDLSDTDLASANTRARQIKVERSFREGAISVRIFGHPLFASHNLPLDVDRMMLTTKPVLLKKFDDVRSNPNVAREVPHFITSVCARFLREGKILKELAETAEQTSDTINQWLAGIVEHTSHIIHKGSEYIQLPTKETRATVLDGVAASPAPETLTAK